MCLFAPFYDAFIHGTGTSFDLFLSQTVFVHYLQRQIHARVQPLLGEKYVLRPEGIQKLVDSPTLNNGNGTRAF